MTHCILICNDWKRLSNYDYLLFRRHLMWADYPDVVVFYATPKLSLRKLLVDTGIISSNAEYKRKLGGIKLNGELAALDQVVDINTPSLQDILFGKHVVEIVVPVSVPWLESQKYKLLRLWKYLQLISTNKYYRLIYSPWWLRHVHNPIVGWRLRGTTVRCHSK